MGEFMAIYLVASPALLVLRLTGAVSWLKLFFIWIAMGVVVYVTEKSEEAEIKEVSQEWHDFTVSNSCGIFEKNEKAGTISWKCADGIIYTKPDSILNGAK